MKLRKKEKEKEKYIIKIQNTREGQNEKFMLRWKVSIILKN